MNLERAEYLYQEALNRSARKTDQTFAYLFIFQWLLAIGFALLWSPVTWTGTQSSIHPHVLYAFILGAILAIYPAYRNLRNPGDPTNRYFGTIAQMGFSVLLIHVSGGRIESHFHIFGSLAFLAFYRDPKVLVLATVITGTDHLVRGWFWPDSIYGVIQPSTWRAIEHFLWVLFEDAFLLVSIRVGIGERVVIARERTLLEESLASTEQVVADRTADLIQTQKKVLDQHQTLLAMSKMTALGEMAAGVAHEVNNPVTTIRHLSSLIAEVVAESEVDLRWLRDSSLEIEAAAIRISSIVSGLKTYTKTTGPLELREVSMAAVVKQALKFEEARLTERSVRVTFDQDENVPVIRGNALELTQVVSHLLSNALDATEGQAKAWVHIALTSPDPGKVLLQVIDSGEPMSDTERSKLFQPFYTTKPIHRGIGLGLCLSLGIIKSHGGEMLLDSRPGATTFRVELPTGKNFSSEGIA